MRNVLLVSWLLLPIGAWAYHEGPGQQLQALESADAVLVRAHAAAAAGDWSGAAREYEAALKAMPKDETNATATVSHRVQVELAKARLESGKLTEAREELEELVEQIAAAPAADAALLADARTTLARAQFLNTWLLRLEGLDRDVWEPEIEAARQNYRLLMETSQGPAADVARRDLEAAVRLERMALEDLQGLPLPKQCNGCCACQCKGKSKKKATKPGGKGAGSGPQYDLGGS